MTPTSKPCYIFDIDGTLADNSHRTHHLHKLPKDWDSYHETAHLDAPHNHMCNLAWIISHDEVAHIIYCSGRHDGQRELTELWLEKHAVGRAFHSGLYMRKEGDHRPDHIIKLELLAQIRADGFEPVMVFDDRNSVVKMWREAGVPCAQVAEGDF